MTINKDRANEYGYLDCEGKDCRKKLNPLKREVWVIRDEPQKGPYYCRSCINKIKNNRRLPAKAIVQIRDI